MYVIFDENFKKNFSWRSMLCNIIDDKEAFTYNGIRLSYKKNKIMKFAATWIKLKGITLSGQSDERTRYRINSLIYGITETYYGSKNDQRQQNLRTGLQNWIYFNL